MEIMKNVMIGTNKWENVGIAFMVFGTIIPLCIALFIPVDIIKHNILLFGLVTQPFFVIIGVGILICSIPIEFNNNKENKENK